VKVATVYADKVCAEATAGTSAAEVTFANTCNQHTIQLPHSMHSMLSISLSSVSCTAHLRQQAPGQNMDSHTV